MQQRLSVYIGERSERVGTLVYDPARPSVSQFCYADSWVSQPNGFAVSPELPLLSQCFFLNDAERNSPFPFAFADTEPDSWGRRLIKRFFRKPGHSRGLSEIDFLLGVEDFSRIGALRFALEGCQPGESKDGRRRTPPLLDLGKSLDHHDGLNWTRRQTMILTTSKEKALRLAALVRSAQCLTNTAIWQSASLQVSTMSVALSKAKFLVWSWLGQQVLMRLSGRW